MHPSAVTHNPLTGKNYTYDNNGNMLTRGNQTLTWDIDNRVSQISVSGGGTTLMEYDYTGMRVKKNAPSGISLYPFQGYEIDPNGIITKFIKIGIETFASKKGSSKYFYHNDHLGGVNVITDIAGTRVQLNEYEPFGGVSRSEGSIDPTHRFTGQELDPETGLYYYGGRYYDQEIGRFVSPDPYVQAPDLPQNLNRYSYVLNNPQSYVDPSGHFIEIIAAIAAVIAASLPEILTAEVITAQMILKLAGQVISAAASTALMTQPQKTTRDAELHREHAKRQQDNLQQARPKVERGNEASPANQNAQDLGTRTGDDTVDRPLDIIQYARWWFPRGFFRTPPPPPGQPKPPGWTPEWKWRYPESKGDPRWFDQRGGEWRWHPPDKWHPEGHWDYNPWDQWNSPWRNLDPLGRPIPSAPPTLPPYRIPELLPDPWA